MDYRLDAYLDEQDDLYESYYRQFDDDITGDDTQQPLEQAEIPEDEYILLPLMVVIPCY